MFPGRYGVEKGGHLPYWDAYLCLYILSPLSSRLSSLFCLSSWSCDSSILRRITHSTHDILSLVSALFSLSSSLCSSLCPPRCEPANYFFHAAAPPGTNDEGALWCRKGWPVVTGPISSSVFSLLSSLFPILYYFLSLIYSLFSLIDSLFSLLSSIFPSRGRA